jgi:ABC-type glycerol-3-phosphate transport system substrate-binding protein/DNA-binding SARP family transcriptional activator
MEFRVLGPLEVWRDSEPIGLESFRRRSLLALLLIHANEIVSTDRIIDELWGDEAGTDRQNALWVHVSGLRSVLEPEREKRAAGTVLVTRAPGYVLQVRPGELDAWRFGELVQEGRALLAQDPAAASLVLGEALALWRGRPYEDVAYEPFAQAAIAELEEQRLEAVELRVDADLRRGLAGELVAELEGLARQHPLRERLTGALMIALYRSGRRADALRAYGRLERRLVEELGVDPSPTLKALEAQVLADDTALVGAGPTAGAPAPLAVRGYELREPIGEGPSGLTYRAYQPVVGREVAIKVTRPDLANDPELIRRFESEAELVARLEHPHIAPLYDFWREPDAAYLVTRLFRRGSLEDAVRDGPLDQAAAAQLVADVGSALSLAHRRRVVHGAVTPSNVLLDDDRRAYLTDFGTILGTRVDGTGVTAPADVAAYAAPEQRGGAPATTRSDLYGLALVLVYGLTGRPPAELALALAELPPGLREVITRATAVEPETRPADVAEFTAAARQALDAAAPDPPAPAENPYKGLLAFEQADAADFFGRDRQVERLVARLGDGGPRGRFVAVVGPSGSGKSSVVHAGLLPALRRGALPGSSRWFTVSMTPGRQPFEDLTAALVSIAMKPPPGLLEELTSGPAGIARAVRQVLPDAEAWLLLVVDQFEELFTQATEATANAFLDALAAAVAEPRNRLRVVVTLRADFYDRPLRHRAMGELFRLGSEVITPMSPEELEEAIAGPATRAGVRFEPGLVAEIVNDVAGRAAALPLLQYALTELYERRRGAVIERTAYRGIGGVSGALARRAEALFDSLDLPARDMVRQVFFRLVALGEGTEVARRRVMRQELTALDGAAVEAVLETFGRHRLLSFDRDPLTRAPTVEIAHEALLSEWDRLRTWLEDGRDDLRQQRRLAAAAREWELAGRDRAYLLRDARLDQAEAWAAGTDLTLHPDERDFLAASVTWRDEERTAEAERRREEEHLRRTTRRRARLLVGGGVVLAVVVALAAFAVVQRDRADSLAAELAATDEARRLAAAADDLAEEDPELATLLALQALDVSADAGIAAVPEAENALHWALQGGGVTFPGGEVRADVRIGPNGPAGVFALPLAELVVIARDHVDRTLTPQECLEHRIAPCPVDGPGLASPAAAGRREVPPEPAATPIAPVGKPLAGTTVTAIGQFPPGLGLDAELERFEQHTGIRVDYTNPVDLASEVTNLVASGQPPDVMLLPQPASVRELASRGELVDLGAYIADPEARAAFGDYLVDSMSTADGLYGLPALIDLKGVVWYPEPEFREAGYEVPATWAELMTLTERMVADGRQPWCMGFESGSATGWPGTDWVEALVLRLGGVDTYDRWIDHEVAFTDPVVRQALAMFGDIAFGDGFVSGGSQSISARNVFDAAGDLFTQEPSCWLHFQASFLTGDGFPPGAAPGVDAGFFLLPPIEAGGAAPAFGGGSFAVAFSDRPEVRTFMGELLSPEWGVEWATNPRSHFLPANMLFDPERCRTTQDDARVGDVRVQFCQAARDAVAAGLWRFDASDVMPPEVGAGTFWQGMVEYVDEGPGSLDHVLADIEAGWP